MSRKLEVHIHSRDHARHTLRRSSGSSSSSTLYCGRYVSGGIADIWTPALAAPPIPGQRESEIDWNDVVPNNYRSIFWSAMIISEPNDYFRIQ